MGLSGVAKTGSNVPYHATCTGGRQLDTEVVIPGPTGVKIINKEICDLTPLEEQEFYSTKSIQRRTTLLELGKQRAIAFREIKEHFDAPLDLILSHFLEENNQIKQDIVYAHANNVIDAIYALKNKEDVNQFRITAAVASVAQYTDVSYEGTYDCYYYNNGSSDKTYPFKLAGQHLESGIATIKGSIDLFRQVNNGLLNDACRELTNPSAT